MNTAMLKEGKLRVSVGLFQDAGLHKASIGIVFNLGVRKRTADV